MERITTEPAKIPYAGDLTPDSELTAVRDIAPPTGMEEKNALKKLVKPK